MTFSIAQYQLRISKLRLICIVDFISDPNKVLHSEMFLSPDEFEDYTIGVDTEVTFCLKELRVSTVLGFVHLISIISHNHIEVRVLKSSSINFGSAIYFFFKKRNS